MPSVPKESLASTPSTFAFTTAMPPANVQQVMVAAVVVESAGPAKRVALETCTLQRRRRLLGGDALVPFAQQAAAAHTCVLQHVGEATRRILVIALGGDEFEAEVARGARVRGRDLEFLLRVATRAQS